ncbi:hypothetical protein GLYMA_06G179500v4 [Glycine max]|uniref:Uncharacterized protein n=1 Tax=Glycine max TaxID=3847 RepID=A0A0R0JIN1_SOYBN|nr:hypothetical protein GLYMA_06G179500v4 [Glycine max]KRH54349.1 hypothetical protein GLYMA_06G179500v4 [Glycine max]KRH54350.1 hypothetical protein GLYMA_06G179500v4 [Glycine max]KRH54351.1 hypothetical protein GLYMA_06G179500v4 [Glycine max]
MIIGDYQFTLEVKKAGPYVCPCCSNVLLSHSLFCKIELPIYYSIYRINGQKSSRH